MDPRLVPLLFTLQLNDRLFAHCFEGVDAEAARRRLSDRTNNMSFVGAHVVEVRFYLASRLGEPVEGPFAHLLDGIRSIDELEEFPEPGAILEGWRRGGELLRERLAGLSPPELDAEFPDPLPSREPTVLGCVNFLLHHEAYHIGQLAMLRKAAGLPAMAY